MGATKRLTYSEYVEQHMAKSTSPLTESEYIDLSDGEYTLEKAAMDGKGDDDGDEGDGEGLADGDGDENGAEAGTGGDDEEEDEDEGEGEGEEKGKKSCTRKSLTFLPTEEELLKSAELLVAQSMPPALSTEEQRLSMLSKAAGDGTITPEGRLELADLLTKSVGSAPTPASDDLRKSLDDDPIVSATTDASEFLAVFADTLVKALGDVEASISADRRHDRQFQRQLALGIDALAKAQIERGQAQDQLIKSLTRRLSALESSPLPYRGHAQDPQILPEQARGPRDPAPVGAVKAAAQLTKAQVLGGLRGMFDRAIEAGDALNKSKLALLIPQVESAGDWRSVRAMADPELLGGLVDAARTGR